MRRFVRGAGYFFRGIGFLFGNPGLWHLAIAPTMLTLIASLAASGVAFRFGADLVHRVAPHAGWLVGALLAALLWLFVLGVAYVAFVVVSLIASAPFLSPLSAATERIASGSVPPSGNFFLEAARSLLHVVLLLLVYLVASGLLLALQLFVPVLAPVSGTLGVIVTALFFAFDAWDPPLSRRGAGFGEKWSMVARHLPEAIGFGSMAALALAVPGFGLVVPALVAIGGTLLFLDQLPESRVTMSAPAAESASAPPRSRDASAGPSSRSRS
jgi:CysZ protein